VRIALTPLVNHWWNATLFVTARGLAAPAMPCAGRTLDVAFDFTNHQLTMETSDGGVESIALVAMPVADFYASFMERLRRLGIDVHIWTMPSEIENAIPFERDRTHAQYNPQYVQKFWLALLQASAADLKFLHHLPQPRLGTSNRKSGTRIINLLVPLCFRSSY
jgi:hypothetical protein